VLGCRPSCSGFNSHQPRHFIIVKVIMIMVHNITQVLKLTEINDIEEAKLELVKSGFDSYVVMDIDVINDEIIGNKYRFVEKTTESVKFFCDISQLKTNPENSSYNIIIRCCILGCGGDNNSPGHGVYYNNFHDAIKHIKYAFKNKTCHCKI
jgi:hypothetical protein